MNNDELAEARHNTYRLLSALFSAGVTAETLPTVQALPALSPFLPAAFDADDAAAEHQALLGLTLLPYESIFLGTDGLLGGALTEALTARFTRLGMTADDRGLGPDHIASQLALLAVLAGAEADAWADGERETAARLQDEARTFMTAHLLRWLPPFAAALQAADEGFYGALGRLTAALVADHLADADAMATSFVLPPLPALLDDPKTGLRDIARFLLTPAYSGFFLTARDIARIGQAARLPRGFGNREQTLVNLMRTAAQYDEWPTLPEGLGTLLARWTALYEQMLAEWPVLAPFVRPWAERLGDTGRLLASLKV